MSIEQELSDALCELDIYLAMYKDLLHDYMLLESRINNGVRVTAWVDDNSTLSCIECIDSDKGNATLILDEVK